MEPNSWEQFKIFADIFKGYLDTALTANIWFYAITGAIFTHYLSNREEKPFVRYSLCLPFTLSLMLAAISIFGLIQALMLKNRMVALAANLKLTGAPLVDILVFFLGLSSLLFILVAVSSGVLLFKPSWIHKEPMKETEPETIPNKA